MRSLVLAGLNGSLGADTVPCGLIRPQVRMTILILVYSPVFLLLWGLGVLLWSGFFVLFFVSWEGLGVDPARVLWWGILSGLCGRGVGRGGW